MSTPKTILFLGATGGVGLAALRRSLAANHTCIALCRTPSKLAAEFPTPAPANLHLIQGDAHDADTLARCLRNPTTTAAASSPVDTVIFSIGARPTLTGRGGMSDPNVCEKGMTALLTALRRVRQEDTSVWEGKKLRLVAVSSTGISDYGRDLPLLMIPLYKIVLHTAHKDKKMMENLVIESSKDGVEWTIVRGSLYTAGPATEGLVREGMEDPVKGVVESTAIGYTISREDVGKWVFEECIQGGRKWIGKAAMITY